MGAVNDGGEKLPWSYGDEIREVAVHEEGYWKKMEKEVKKSKR